MFKRGWGMRLGAQYIVGKYALYTCTISSLLAVLNYFEDIFTQ